MKRASTETEQFVINADGQRVAVILDLERYRRLREAEEELAEIKAYDMALPEVTAAMKKGDFLTLQDFETKHFKKRA